jgi:hypothetical protein
MTGIVHHVAPTIPIWWLIVLGAVLFICILAGWTKRYAILFSGDFADGAKESEHKGAFWFFMIIDHLAFLVVLFLLYKELNL